MKKLLGILLFGFLALGLAGPAPAQEPATPQEVYDMVAKAAYLMGELKEEGLPAFNDPKGEFAWKDTYVIVVDCAKQAVVGHPSPQVRQMDAAAIKCKKTGRPILTLSCERGQEANVKTQGYWSEYWWTKPGSDATARKVSFALPVPNTTYMVSAGIWNETVTLEALNATGK